MPRKIARRLARRSPASAMAFLRSAPVLLARLDRLARQRRALLRGGSLRRAATLPAFARLAFFLYVFDDVESCSALDAMISSLPSL